ncbi:MAG: hypothetical protein NZ870_03760 [bacterium]|nr:hypothetical protein [bacterium]
MIELNKLLDSLNKKEVSLSEVAKFIKNGVYPHYRLKQAGKVIDVSKEEWEKIRKEYVKEKLEQLKKELPPEELPDEEEILSDWVSLSELPKIEKLIKNVSFLKPEDIVVQSIKIKKASRVEFTEPLKFIFTLKEILKDVIQIQRYKGLGEMNPEQLYETTMDPQRRNLIKVTIEDAMEADRIVNTLLGKETYARKDFIIKHALEVQNLDI